MLRGSLSTPGHQCRDPNARTDQHAPGPAIPKILGAPFRPVQTVCRLKTALIRRAGQQLDDQGVETKEGYSMPICSGVQGELQGGACTAPVPKRNNFYATVKGKGTAPVPQRNNFSAKEQLFGKGTTAPVPQRNNFYAPVPQRNNNEMVSGGRGSGRERGRGCEGDGAWSRGDCGGDGGWREATKHYIGFH